MENIMLTSSLLLLLAMLLVLNGFMGLGRTTVLGVIVAALSVVFLWGGTSLVKNYEKSDDFINKAKFLSSCKLLEENIYHGYFSQNTNKLDCNGTIKNISTSEYNSAMKGV